MATPCAWEALYKPKVPLNSLVFQAYYSLGIAAASLAQPIAGAEVYL